jgi:hypothetical protein
MYLFGPFPALTFLMYVSLFTLCCFLKFLFHLCCPQLLCGKFKKDFYCKMQDVQFLFLLLFGNFLL